MDRDTAASRLHNQYLSRGLRGTPEDVVARFGAIQAQEYPFAKWALALRLARESSSAEIDEAFDIGRILRTHVLRPTWHFVTPADIRWMLELTAPHVQRTVKYYIKRRGIEPRVLGRATSLFERALHGGRHLTRAELATQLGRAGLRFPTTELWFVTLFAELEAVICSGPRRGKQFTYALLDERAPASRRLSRDEAVAELTRRFFTSHAPATVRDFVWWSGLTVAETRRGLEINRARPIARDGLTYWTVGRTPAGDAAPGTAHLLPIYDEYLVAYRDRTAVPHAPGHLHSAGSSVTFRHAVIIGGQVAGTWNTRTTTNGHGVEVTPLRRLSPADCRAIAAAAARYGRFLESPVSLTIG